MKKIWALIVILLIAGAAGFVYFSPMFERIPPKIKIITNGFTNLQKPIEIIITDNRGIRSYEVIAKAKNFDEIIAKSSTNDLGKRIVLHIKLPHDLASVKKVKLTVIATDTSDWHFFKGNTTKKSVTLIVDTIPPNVVVIDNSYAIGRGGSAAVVVEVNDKYLKNAYVLVNKKYKFKLIPFVKKGYYAALIAWPYKANTFDANVVATDYAGNKSITHIPLYWRTGGIYQFHPKKLTISKDFIENVSKSVLLQMGMKVPSNPVQIFQMENNTLREIDNKDMSKITRKVYELSENKIVKNFNIRMFNPMPGSVKQEIFMDLNHYYYNGKEISTAVNLGVDLAKTVYAKVYASNPGIVVAEKYEGIYGNTLFIYHGLGLYSSYSYLSKYLVKPGQSVHRGEAIARAGATGAISGFPDQLHFSMYIQGVFVNPLEWMDPYWVKVNIINILNNAKKIINQ